MIYLSRYEQIKTNIQMLKKNGGSCLIFTPLALYIFFNSLTVSSYKRIGTFTDIQQRGSREKGNGEEENAMREWRKGMRERDRRGEGLRGLNGRREKRRRKGIKMRGKG